MGYDRATAIRCKTIKSARLSPEEMAALSVDPVVEFRSALAKRKDLPREVVARLAKDDAPSVRNSLLKTRGHTEENAMAWAEALDRRFRRVIAKWEDLPEEVFMVLIKDLDGRVKEILDARTDLPDSVVKARADWKCLFGPMPEPPPTAPAETVEDPLAALDGISGVRMRLAILDVRAGCVLFCSGLSALFSVAFERLSEWIDASLEVRWRVAPLQKVVAGAFTGLFVAAAPFLAGAGRVRDRAISAFDWVFGGPRT